MIHNKTKAEYEEEQQTYRPCAGVQCYNKPRADGWCDEHAPPEE